MRKCRWPIDTEGMLNVVNHQGYENQNHNEMSPHTGKNGYYQKGLQITNIGENVEERVPLHTSDEGKLVQPLWKTVSAQFS